MEFKNSRFIEMIVLLIVCHLLTLGIYSLSTAFATICFLFLLLYIFTVSINWIYPPTRLTINFEPTFSKPSMNVLKALGLPNWKDARRTH